MLIIDDRPVISLDLETGGLEPGKHTVLSIGAAIVPGFGFCRHKNESYAVTKNNSFYCQLEWDTVTVDPRAMRINRLDIAHPPGKDGVMADFSLPAHEGINLFHKWLANHESSLIYVMGMNVGSFDLPMLKSIWNYGSTRKWPFHYRSIDLNSLFFALSQIQNKPFEIIKKEITEAAWEQSSFSKDMEHNALADAWSNVYVWEECLRRLGLKR